MENPDKVTITAKSLPRFDGKNKHDFIDLTDNLEAILSMSAPDIYNILMGEEKPTPTEDEYLAKWERNNTPLHARPGCERGRRHGGEAPRRHHSEGRTWKRTEGLESVGGKVERLQQRHSTGAV